MGLAGPGANWRMADAYAPLRGADRSIFAWEWLRRDPAYRRAVAEASLGSTASEQAAEARAWGLLGFEHPGLAAPRARPFWRADHHGSVLRAHAMRPAAPGDRVELGALRGASALVTNDGEHWLFSDGIRAIRLDLVDGSATAGPVELHYLLFGSESLRGPLLSLRQLTALADRNDFAKTLHAPERRALRWILMLRVHDALAANATQREIAAELLSKAAGGPRWRIETASVRSQVQRLVRAAVRLGRGGYRDFLK